MSLVSLEMAARLNNSSKINLQKLRSYDKRNGRNDRFFGQLVDEDYPSPLKGEAERYYFSALAVSNNEKELARYIAKRTKKKTNTVYMYFRNFKFKNQDFTKKVIGLLDDYIRENSLFADYFLGVAK